MLKAVGIIVGCVVVGMLVLLTIGGFLIWRNETRGRDGL